MAKSEELKNFLMKVKGESEKFGLKLNIQKTKIMVSNPITSWQIDGETGKDYFWASKSLQMVTVAMKLKWCLLLGRKAMTNLDSILKSRDIPLLKTVCIVKAMFFSCHHVRMWDLDHKASWGLKNWCFWTIVLEKTLENPLDCKAIKPINPKGNKSWTGLMLEGLMLKLKL